MRACGRMLHDNTSLHSHPRRYYPGPGKELVAKSSCIFAASAWGQVPVHQGVVDHHMGCEWPRGALGWWANILHKKPGNIGRPVYGDLEVLPGFEPTNMRSQAPHIKMGDPPFPAGACLGFPGCGLEHGKRNKMDRT